MMVIQATTPKEKEMATGNDPSAPREDDAPVIAGEGDDAVADDGAVIPDRL